jgi:hypothetical protein
MLSTIGVREKTGKNDGVHVEKYLRNVGMPKGNPWCAAYVRYGFDSCGVRTKITAWSPTAHNPKKIVWKQGFRKDPKAGRDVFTVWYVSLKRVGHTGFYLSMPNPVTVETVEGNTSVGGSRNGDGVYRRKRALNSLYSICEAPR